MPTTQRDDIATQRNGIDLSQFELGTLFTYTPADAWCHDGQAEIVEMFGVRYLVDTYWGSGLEGVLSVEQGREATVTFVPSEHRTVTEQEARVYGEKAIVIQRHGGHRRTYFVKLGEPPLTEADHYRHMLLKEEERLAEHQRGVESSARHIEFLRARIEKLENQ